MKPRSPTIRLESSSYLMREQFWFIAFALRFRDVTLSIAEKKKRYMERSSVR